MGFFAVTNATNMSADAWTTEVFIPQVLDRTGDMLTAPIGHSEMLWIAAPLVLSLILMMVYFSRYTTEELGWNSAVGNSLLLVFVAVDLLRYIYTNPFVETPIEVGGFPLPLKLVVALLVLLEGFTLAFADFFHFLPKKVAFFLCSAIPVNLTAYVAITIVYTNIPFDVITVVSAMFMFVILYTVFELAKTIHGRMQGD